MATTPTTNTPSGRTGWIVTTAALLVLAAALLIGALLASRDTTAISDGETANPATASDPERGNGDPCSHRRETGGGFFEGLDPANRCAGSTGQPRTGGHLP
jgi:hypothetical protein